MLVGKFPQKAIKILNKIRNEVKKPGLRSCKMDTYDALRWFWSDGEYCPMGMLKNAISDKPCDSMDFEDNEFTDNQIKLFANWFDRQTDKVAVVDFIWGA